MQNTFFFLIVTSHVSVFQTGKGTRFLVSVKLIITLGTVSI